MKITSIHIQDDNSLLKDFKWSSDKPINILIGENGSGKTSLLKYLVWVFIEARNKYVNHKNFANPPFKFSIDYSIKLDEQISNSESKTEYLSVNLNNKRNEKDPWSLTVKNTIDPVNKTEQLLPENIIAYYAGWDDSIKWLFEDVEERYKDLARENPETRLDFGYSKIDNLPLLYIQKIHFDMLLACMFSYEYNFKLNEKLEKEFGIVKEEKSAIAVFIKKPPKVFNSKGNYDNFWGASGEILQFLNNIKSRALGQGTYNKEKEYFTFVFHLSEWYDLKDFYGSEKRLYYFFHLLNASDLLSGFQIFFKKDNETITNRKLSEGEQQLLTILGVKELLLERNSLILLDEPDTFLHPTWQEQFIPNIIDNIFDLPINEISHFEPNYFITTHSPNLLKNADNEYVKVHTLEKGEVLDYSPKFYGRSISSINYNLMGVEERPVEIKEQFKELFKAIESEKLKDAKKIYKDLVLALNGEDDEDLIQAKVEIEFLEGLDGDD